jgi:hypothetical protein
MADVFFHECTFVIVVRPSIEKFYQDCAAFNFNCSSSQLLHCNKMAGGVCVSHSHGVVLFVCVRGIGFIDCILYRWAANDEGCKSHRPVL